MRQGRPASAPSLLRPFALPRGGTIGVCSPAGPIDEPCLAWGERWLRDAGFEVRCAPHVRTRTGYLAGSDATRREDFLQLIRDPDVHAIFYSRGGYGTSRWLDGVDPSELRRARKLVVGHSDATALSLFLQVRAGLVSLHGPMLQRSDLTPAAQTRVLALACGEPEGLVPLAGRSLRGGSAEGPLVGGNLTLVTSSLGTPWEIQTDGAILFLEDTSEQPYAIDRQLTQLRAAGKLSNLAGLALGEFVHCESKRYPERTAADVLYEISSSAFAGPIVAELPFGHIANNWALPVGVRARIDAAAGTLALMQAAVEERSG